MFTEAVENLCAAGLEIIVHVILGLPGETPEQMYETVSFLNTLPVFGVKLQLLHVLAGTDLGALYEASREAVPILSMEEYLRILIHCLELLSPQIVIHRVTGDGPRNLTLAPKWSLNKRMVLNTLLKTMREQNTYQGRLYHDTGPSHSL